MQPVIGSEPSGLRQVAASGHPGHSARLVIELFERNKPVDQADMPFDVDDHPLPEPRVDAIAGRFRCAERVLHFALDPDDPRHGPES